jgi:alpha-L-arabinofuranosidase
MYNRIIDGEDRHKIQRQNTGMHLLRYAIVPGLLVLFGAASLQASPSPSVDAQITVAPAIIVGHPGTSLYGSCIEDVNHEIYGGLYDQKLFGESFEEPAAAERISGWTAYGGIWRGASQLVSVNSDPGAKLVSNLPAISDGTFQADVLIGAQSTQNAGLLVRLSSPGEGADSFTGYEISLSPSSQTVILGKHVQDWRPIETRPAALLKGDWNNLQVVMTGSRIQVFINHSAQPVIDYNDTRSPLLSGQVALRTWNSDASFRNVQINDGKQVSDLSFVVSQAGSPTKEWDTEQTGNAPVQFERDSVNPYNGSYSLKIVRGIGSGQAEIANEGLNHWGISVKKGQVFDGHIYLRAEDLKGPVTIGLQNADGSVNYATKSVPVVSGAWGRYSFTLRTNVNDPNARFAVWFNSPGTLWADQAVLMGTGSERFAGLPIRADIAKAIVDEGVKFMRYGGTMVNVPNYRWKNMIGDRDKRPPYVGNWYPCSTNGFGIFDYLNFCEAAHIDAAFAINAEETDQDAADLADYLTAPASTQWGHQRQLDGHPAPYHVRYIEVGNEEVIGSDDQAAYAHYADRFTHIAQAIHGRNPGLQLVCAAWWRPDSPNMKPVFDAVDGSAAAWDLHVWSDDANAGTGIDDQISKTQAAFKQWDPNTKLKVVIFEENGNLHNFQRALGHVTTLNASLRHSDFVVADCAANALQPLNENDNGWDQGQIFFTPSQVWGMPPYYTEQMASKAAQPLIVQATAVSPANDLNVTAERSLDGKSLVLLVVNTGNQNHSASVNLGDFMPGQTALVSTISGQPSDVNAPDQPTKISPQRTSIAVTGPTFEETFPAYSYTTVQLKAK